MSDAPRSITLCIWKAALTKSAEHSEYHAKRDAVERATNFTVRWVDFGYTTHLSKAACEAAIDALNLPPHVRATIEAVPHKRRY